MRGVWLATAMMMCGADALAQTQPLGSVPIADAEVQTTLSGATPVSAGNATLVGASTVTAKPGRNAEMTLARGGGVLVCQTSTLHATPSGKLLVLALDRGALEMHFDAAAGDTLMTPDMRITLTEAGPLDVRMRVTFNGDTCVENRGRKAPSLTITDAFGDASYQVKPNQHVMFEHGSLREVVDRETTPCGCPPEEKPGASVADAILSGGKLTPAQAAAAGNPFPAAQSDGLAAPAAVAETSGAIHTEISTTLAFDANAPAAPQTSVPTIVPNSATEPQPAPRKAGAFSAIGRFFKRIFAR